MRYVYFMETQSPRRVKIRVATKPEVRRAELQSGNPQKIEIVALVLSETPFQVERFLHHRFRHLRMQGEWFRTDPDLRCLIKAFARYPLGARLHTWAETGAVPTLIAKPLAEEETADIAYAIYHAAAVMNGEPDFKAAA